MAGTIKLSVTFDIAPQQVQVNINLFVVHVDSAYNVILGRTTLAVFQAITYIPHFKIKVPKQNGVGEVK